MSDTSTDTETVEGEAELARPYARAVFELARAGNSFESWNDSLALMAAVVTNPTMRSMLDNPRLTRADAARLMGQACGDDIGEKETNLLNMLAENGRLDQLPTINKLYGELRDAAAGTVEAEVISARALTEDQKSAIASALARRLGREVNLNCSVNEDLLGGAIVRAGDLVIDGSAIDHLRQLSSNLVH